MFGTNLGCLQGRVKTQGGMRVKISEYKPYMGMEEVDKNELQKLEGGVWSLESEG